MRPRKNIRHFADEISKFIHCMNSIVFWLSLYSHKLVWWRHQMETFSALLTLCLGNSLVTKGQWRGLWFFFYLSLNKPLSKQLWGWWFEMPSRSLWRHCNGVFHQNRPYLHVLVVSTGQPLIRSVILYSCNSNIQEKDIKLYMVMYSTICASHTINCISTLSMVLQMWI